MKLNHENLLELLKQKNLDPTFQPENDQSFIVMMISNHEVPIFFGIRGNQTLLQTIAYIPFEMAPRTIGEVARLLHILNHQVDMPGFGIDEEQRLMFYRLVIPCLNGEFDERLLDLYLGTTRVAVETFMGAISLVASGSVTVDSVLKRKENG